MKIVPAILADDFDTFLTRVHQAEKFVDFVQIDIMDGEFVGTRSFDLKMIKDIPLNVQFEAHLMVQKPLDVLKTFHNQSLKKAIFHIEASGDPMEFIDAAKERGLETGLAMKPETPVESCSKIARYVDSLLFLTVDPGQYGSPFKPDVVKKLPIARAQFPNIKIGVDGGVSLENLHIFYNDCVNYVCIGSRIFVEGDPGDNYKRFNDWLVELETSR